jgi:hypothetical protein
MEGPQAGGAGEGLVRVPREEGPSVAGAGGVDGPVVGGAALAQDAGEGGEGGEGRARAAGGGGGEGGDLGRHDQGRVGREPRRHDVLVVGGLEDRHLAGEVRGEAVHRRRQQLRLEGAGEAEGEGLAHRGAVEGLPGVGDEVQLVGAEAVGARGLAGAHLLDAGVDAGGPGVEERRVAGALLLQPLVVAAPQLDEVEGSRPDVVLAPLLAEEL